jgi:hypothetical protein
MANDVEGESGYTVAQLVEALRYKPEDGGNFSLA